MLSFFAKPQTSLGTATRVNAAIVWTVDADQIKPTRLTRTTTNGVHSLVFARLTILPSGRATCQGTLQIRLQNANNILPLFWNDNKKVGPRGDYPCIISHDK
jgi:hypothetical protein